MRLTVLELRALVLLAAATLAVAAWLGAAVAYVVYERMVAALGVAIGNAVGMWL